MAQTESRGHSVPPYGVSIRKSISGGNLAEMKKVRDQAETYLADHGDIGAALEILKAAIAKAEAR